ncbi:MAG: hypothetical protein H6618_05295 [Deltaproteobacteria bacterium]|nr:hypothetical protein [Deltaproteobacteria bacterium]
MASCSEEISVIRGSIHAYRIFDIGSEMDILHAEQLLKDQNASQYSPDLPGRGMLIAERPLGLILSSWTESIADQEYQVIPFVKIWSFGTISIRFRLDLDGHFSLPDLCEISHYLENSESFHQKAVNQVTELITLLNPAIKKPGLWRQFEDYLFFHFEKITEEQEDLKKVFYGDGISSLILGEKYMEFSDQINDSVASTIFQYEKNDLLLIHWNGSILYDAEHDENILHVIEFALCQLLELRYYDDLLDHQLESLYHKIENKRGTVFRNPYTELARFAALEYIDISDIVDKVGNAFKIIGDFYYATIFRAATEKFQIPVWRKIVDHKLGNLAEVSRLFLGDVNEKRNQILEGIIIVLIAIEVIPFILSLTQH